jgi:hypothetical protein
MSNGLRGSKVMRQGCVETLITEEPDDRIGHVRICGGDGQQWLSLPGSANVHSVNKMNRIRINSGTDKSIY